MVRNGSNGRVEASYYEQPVSAAVESRYFRLAIQLADRFSPMEQK